MRVLSRMKFSAKLNLMTSASLLGLALFAVVAFGTLHEVQINSAMYQKIALGYQLAGDCYDPPASLLEALAPAISAEDATTPEETLHYFELVRQAHTAFEAAHQHYQQVLPDGRIRDVMRMKTYPAGHQWYEIAEQKYLPMLLAGDHEGARQIRIAQMDPLFAAHKAGNDELAQLTGDWIPALEAEARVLIHSHCLILLAIALVMAIALVSVGMAISHAIVGPVREGVRMLEAMSAGDLTHHVQVDSTDEMQEMADALNQTRSSFREVLASLAEVSSQTATAAAELTATAQDTAQQSRERAFESQQSAAAIEEMSSAIAEVSTTAADAAKAGTSMEDAADSGHKMVAATHAAIQQAAATTSRIAEKIYALGDNSEEIGKIVGVIAEIAGQTNLLALNAAIEASRAGEQGRGFAVVAGEVRSLAERTTRATEKIAEMVKTIQKQTANVIEAMNSGREEVEGSLQKVKSCDQPLTQIVELARTSGDMAQQIANAASQQTTAARQVSAGVHSLSSFTAHSAAASEQTLAACNNQSQLASTLNERVNRFHLAA